jgi:hypothetical protein
MVATEESNSFEHQVVEAQRRNRMPPIANGLEVIYQPWTVLQPNPQNARTHSKRQIKLIAESIRAFGFANPVLIEQSNTIIAGHGRVEAAKLLGLKEVPTIRLRNLTPDQVRAYVIADNRLAEKAGWDESILAIELQHLLTVELGFEVSITGFEVPEIDLILDRAAGKPSPEEVSEPVQSGPAVTRPGDLWLLGKHRILCGNSLEEDSYVRLMRAERQMQYL